MPLSDVTSISKINVHYLFLCQIPLIPAKPTNDGQLCAVPYKVGNFTWDMYFCNQGYCPTTMSPNSTCKLGKINTQSSTRTSQ